MIKNQILVGAIQPNLIIGVAYGAEMVFPPDKDADIKGQPLASIRDTDQLPTPASILETDFIKKLDRQWNDLHREHPEKQIIPPFFLGYFRSGDWFMALLPQLKKLFGESVFTDMLVRPDYIDSLFSWILETYMILVQHYSALGKIPVTMVHIGECSGAMLSPEQYEQFIIPYASNMGELLGPIRFHTCGFSDHLLSAISKIENLQVVDTGSNTSVRLMREIFGLEKELNVAPPVDLLLEGSEREKVILWLKQVLEENQDGPLKLVYHLEPGYSLENCLGIHEELSNRGYMIKGRIHF